MKTCHRIIINGIFLMLLICGGNGFGQTGKEIFKAAGSPENPKVRISWNRYYSSEGLNRIAGDMEKAYPDLVKTYAIGKSYQGRDILVLEITDHTKQPPEEKPGFYIDGNIHSNEIQGSEFALYTAWYLAETFNENDWIHELLEEKVFYIVPTINPDARDSYMQDPNTAHTPRSGMIPFDDDRDGLYDEDGYDDVNGDGFITLMRRKDPDGRYKTDPEHPRWIIPAKPDESGEYELLGYEGFDNDGDGKVNEDRVGGYYDPNRDWGWDWQPDYIQRGAYKYPLSTPENRAVAEFVMSHPNIAGAQSYHNSGGMILRGPGTKYDESSFEPPDKKVYDALGKKGEELLPGYKYMVIYNELYPTFGGEISWFHGNRGVFCFSNEIFTDYLLFDKNVDTQPEEQNELLDFDKYLLFEGAFVDWKPFIHPVYGDIEIGGFKRNYTRLHPGFMLENDAHRNMAFTLYHAFQTPKLIIEKLEEKELGQGLRQITVTIANKRLIPTHSAQDLKYHIEHPDYAILSGPEVIVGMLVLDKDFNETKEQPYTPEKLEIPNIPGMNSVTVRWIVKGSQDYHIILDSAKGGRINE